MINWKKRKFLALDNHQGKEGLSFSPNIVNFNSNKYSSLNNSRVIQKFKCLPNPIYFNSCSNVKFNPKVQPNLQPPPQQPVTTPIIPAQPVVTKTTDIPDYDTAQVSQVPLTNKVQALVSMVNSVDVQPSTVISTQPHTKYR